MINEDVEKSDVRDFWNDASCGEYLYLTGQDLTAYLSQRKKRYELEPYIPEFAQFESVKGKKVLEIGVGLGADHQGFAENGADLYGIDLTDRAINHVQKRFEFMNLKSSLKVGDAEALGFPDNYFDYVYSWGVIHHSPNTTKAASEILRVLKPGGEYRVMVYYTHSLIGWMLWLRYALLKGRLRMTLAEIYSRYLESPGTKAYTIKEAEELFEGSSRIKAWTVLTHGDLLEGAAGQRHEGVLLNFARKLWPRFIIRKVFRNNGLFLLISGNK